MKNRDKKEDFRTNIFARWAAQLRYRKPIEKLSEKEDISLTKSLY